MLFDDIEFTFSDARAELLLKLNCRIIMQMNFSVESVNLINGPKKIFETCEYLLYCMGQNCEYL